MSRDIPINKLRQLLRLDVETGRLYWRERPVEFCKNSAYAARWNTKNAGKEAFTGVDALGYQRGGILSRKYLAHRVVFALANGRWPVGPVDHRDGNPGNNRPENLREATIQQNNQNTSGRGGSSPFKGTYWHEARKKWYAQCKSGGRNRFLGYFDEETAAARAYDNFVRVAHGEFARLNFPLALSH